MNAYEVSEADVEAYDSTRSRIKVATMTGWFIGTAEEAELFRDFFEKLKITSFLYNLSYNASFDNLTKYLKDVEDPLELAMMLPNIHVYFFIKDSSVVRMEDRGELPEEERSALCRSLNIQ